MQQLALRSKLQAESVIHMKVWDCQLHSATRVDWCQQKRPWGGEKYERGRGTLSVCHYTVMIDIIRLWYVWIGAHLVKKLFRFLRQCTILTGHSRKVKVVRAEPHLAAHGHTLHYSQRTHFCQPFPANLSTSRKKKEKGAWDCKLPSLSLHPAAPWLCSPSTFFETAEPSFSSARLNSLLWRNYPLIPCVAYSSSLKYKAWGWHWWCYWTLSDLVGLTEILLF